MSYWKICIEEAFGDAKIEATEEQISLVASFVEGAHDNYSTANGHDDFPSYSELENKKLMKELREERKKVICPDCKGKGSERSQGPIHSSWMTCDRCGGSGMRVL